MDVRNTINTYIRMLINNPLLWSSIIVLLIILWFVISMNNLTSYPCKDIVISEVTSPDDKLKASVFVRNCGATTDYSTQVSIRDYGSSFDPEKQQVVFITRGKNTVKLSWASPNKLIISYIGFGPKEIFKQEPLCNKTVVQYKQSSNY